MVGWILFHEGDPENWGDLGTAMLSTFTMLTLENWPKLLEQGMAIHPNSWIFFVSYVLLASFLVINILIAIIINSVEQVHQVEREEERAERQERLVETDPDAVTIAARLTGLKDALDDLELDLQSGGTLEATGPTTKRPMKGGRMRG
jgi:voltage-gated sodium channel